MSETLNELILSTQPTFQELDAANGKLLDFKQECLFARQQIAKNSYTSDAANKNPISLKSAIYNVASIGISLNPALAHAYLVPRDGAICLDISYRGLVKLATDCGAIQWAKTELVYENDTFTWNGPNKDPEHKAEVFGDRGEVIGGYCIAKLMDGSVMVEVMKRAGEGGMDQIQATSKAKLGPWKTWPDEMRKKSVTKRASKSWPQTGSRERIDRAIEVLNQHEGLIEQEAPEIAYTEQQQFEYQRCVDESDFFNLAGLTASLDAEQQKQLFFHCVPEGEKGQKMAVKKAFSENAEEGRMELENSNTIIDEMLEAGDDFGVYEVVKEYSPWSIDLLHKKLSPAQVLVLEDIISDFSEEEYEGEVAA